jgi:ribosomal protein L7/L12
MYVPISYLVVGGLLVLLLGWLLLRRRGGERDLLAPPPGLRPSQTPRPAAAPVGGVQGEVQALLAGGNKIAAVKLVREAYQLGLGEAKTLVEAFERGEPAALPDAAVPTPIVDLDAEIRGLLAANRKIEAIKRAREVLGLGLAEAKHHVEAIERRH